jgi:hypothetical protein
MLREGIRVVYIMSVEQLMVAYWRSLSGVVRRLGVFKVDE